MSGVCVYMYRCVYVHGMCVSVSMQCVSSEVYICLCMLFFVHGAYVCLCLACICVLCTSVCDVYGWYGCGMCVWCDVVFVCGVCMCLWYVCVW